MDLDARRLGVGRKPQSGGTDVTLTLVSGGPSRLTCPGPGDHTCVVERARRHQIFLARLALALLVLVAELAGRSLTHRVNIGRHVETRYAGAEYYPFLLAAVKVGVALMLARVAWRFVKARSVAAGARRLLDAQGRPAGDMPRVRLDL